MSHLTLFLVVYADDTYIPCRMSKKQRKIWSKSRN